MAKHLTIRTQSITGQEEERGGQEDFEQIKDNYNFDIDVFNSIRIRMADQNRQDTTAIDYPSGAEEEVEETEEHLSPSNQPPQKKNKRSRNKKKAAAWRA